MSVPFIEGIILGIMLCAAIVLVVTDVKALFKKD